jgi:hypothetical protein
LVNLLAKNKFSGWYYFNEDDGPVYLIKPPFEILSKTFVDELKVFLRRSIDTDLLYEVNTFKSMDEFIKYVYDDYNMVNVEMIDDSLEIDENILIFATEEIVYELFAYIQERISSSNFKGLKTIFRQLEKCNALHENSELLCKCVELKNDFDKSRFSNIGDINLLEKVEKRIKKEKNVLSAA